MTKQPISLCHDLLNDYLFDQLDLDRRIEVETKLANDPDLAAKVAGYRARILALKKLAELRLDADVPDNLTAIVTPLLPTEDQAIQPGRFANWFSGHGHHLIDHHAGDLRHAPLSDHPERQPDLSPPRRNGSL